MSSEQQPTIIYTLTDEAPLLATYAFLPIIRAFAKPAGVNVESCDSSVAARSHSHVVTLANVVPSRSQTPPL